MELWSLLSITAPGLFPDPKRFAEHYARPIERERRPRAARAPAAADQAARQAAHEGARRGRPAGQAGADARDRAPPAPPQALRHPPPARAPEDPRAARRLRPQPLHDPPVDHAAAPAEPPLRRSSTSATQASRARSSTRSSSSSTIVIGGGHRALVFSQFTGFLAKVRARLDDEGIGYCYLDGRTRQPRARARALPATASDPVFLISLKAGGVGLNLTEADYCFLLDPWWNPATETPGDRPHAPDRPDTAGDGLPADRPRHDRGEGRRARAARKAELFRGVMDDGDLVRAQPDRRRHPRPAGVTSSTDARPLAGRARCQSDASRFAALRRAARSAFLSSGVGLQHSQWANTALIALRGATSWYSWPVT